MTATDVSPAPCSCILICTFARNTQSHALSDTSKRIRTGAHGAAPSRPRFTGLHIIRTSTSNGVRRINAAAIAASRPVFKDSRRQHGYEKEQGRTETPFGWCSFALYLRVLESMTAPAVA